MSMAKRRGVVVAIGVVVALVLVSATVVAALRSRSGGAAAGVTFGPRAITVDPNASPVPLKPIQPGRESKLLTRPGKLPITAAGLDPDAQRVVDVTSLQLSLERYRVAWGSYPDALDKLFPDFAPIEGGRRLTALPVDPVTHRLYGYRLVLPARYEITATMSSGRPWHGVRP
jgi:hypothetical protein